MFSFCRLFRRHIVDPSLKFNDIYISSIIDILSAEYCLRKEIVCTNDLNARFRKDLQIRKLICIYVMKVSNYGELQHLPSLTQESILHLDLILDVYKEFDRIYKDSISNIKESFVVDELERKKQIILIGVKSSSVV